MPETGPAPSLAVGSAMIVDHFAGGETRLSRERAGLPIKRIISIHGVLDGFNFLFPMER